MNIQSLGIKVKIKECGLVIKIGYPCINNSLSCKSSSGFRLKNYSQERVKKTVKSNLDCLQQILQYNKEHGIYFFRISSDLIPFASHSIMDFEWQTYFKKTFQEIGTFIKSNKMRTSMHPGQYTVLNSNKKDVYYQSIKNLQYHTELLDLMELDTTAKIQLHVGGVYGNKRKSLQRFIDRYKKLNDQIRNRLIIENDERSYNLNDCILINKQTEIPVVLDIYHHKLNNQGDTMVQGFQKVKKTWAEEDGPPIIHYSTQKVGGNPGNHAQKLDAGHFKHFLKEMKLFDFDIMIEIKDKEKSALKALELLKTIY